MIYNLTIKQGKSASCLSAYKFEETYGLKKYNNKNESSVFYGCYTIDEKRLVEQHESLAVVWWTGSDALCNAVKYTEVFKRNNVLNITIQPNIYKQLSKLQLNPILIKRLSPEKPKPQVLGDKVYAYIPKDRKKYHNSDIVSNVQKKVPFQFVIGDGTIPVHKWKNGECEKYYSQCFLGLCLCNFAGSAGTIRQLGLRGMRCITNVIGTPNIILWKDEDDIISAIYKESKNIGNINKDLAIDVYNSFCHYRMDNGLDLGKLFDNIEHHPTFSSVLRKKHILYI